jgi:hypothetical protein
MDDLHNPGSEDGKRIALEEPHEVRYWTRALGVSEERLRAVVAEVGYMAADVRKYLTP